MGDDCKMREKQGGVLISNKPEFMIEARYKLNAMQNDLMEIFISKIEQDEKLEYEITVSDYINVYENKTQKHVYSDLKKASKSMEGLGFRIYEKNPVTKKVISETYYPWFTKIKYIHNEGRIQLDIHKDVKKMFIEQKMLYHYNLKYVLNFSNIYSKRIYVLLKEWEIKRKGQPGETLRFDNIKDLEYKLEIPKSYIKFAQFRKNVLDIAQKEINDNSDISFTYKLEKTQAKYTKIIWNIKTKKKLLFEGDQTSLSKVLTVPEIKQKDVKVPKQDDDKYISNKINGIWEDQLKKLRDAE
jgi:plasmid replication initiation protein